MLVRELIEKLQQMDQDAVVKFWQETDSSGGWKDVEFVNFEDCNEGESYACIE